MTLLQMENTELK